jgi:hypothetical protein
MGLNMGCVNDVNEAQNSTAMMILALNSDKIASLSIIER